MRRMTQAGIRRVSMSSNTSRRPPLLVVVGATGTGKSQLAVSLAERFNGEVVNGDALQMYEGLPVTTNKISPRAKKGVPHHLMDCVSLDQDPWTVRNFCEEASRTIDEIRSRGKLAIVVGGTHYYTQSLLFPESLVEDVDTRRHMSNEQEERKWPILSASKEEMLGELRKVDPVMAQRWHPHDVRKIRRSLQIWLQTGIRASEIYLQQQQVASRGALRDHDPLIFWTHSLPEPLDRRLDERVDSMIAAGLLDEVHTMRHALCAQRQQGVTIDDTAGIWIAIGYKELLPYIDSRDEKDMIEGIERTKIATRQYAKRQSRWIRHKLLHALKAVNLEQRMYLLDSSDVSLFAPKVSHIANQLVSAFLAGERLPDPATISDVAASVLRSSDSHDAFVRHCMPCNKYLTSETQWERHTKSKGHKSAIRPRIDWQALYPRNASV